MSRALSRATVSVVLAAAVAVSVAACTGPPMPTPTTAAPSPSGDGILRIGTLFPKSGPLAVFSWGQVAGVNAAVREINAAGGVLGAPVEVVSRDAGDDDSAVAAASFDDLVAHGADVVIGPSSSAVAESLLPAAAAAAVPLISPSARGVQLADADAAGWFFRTIPTDADEGSALARLLMAAGASDVVLVGAGGMPGQDVSDALDAALTAQEGGLTQVAGEGDPAAVAAEVDDAGPDAVVLAAPDGGEATAALIAAITEAGYGGDRLWLAGPALVGYGDALPPDTLTGARGILAGFPPDAALRSRLLLEDPGVRSLRFAVEAYDATILAALAATLAGDDGGASIDNMLPSAAAGGIPCSSFGECVDVLSDRDDIDYQGLSGPVDLDETGDVVAPGFAVYGYAPENTLVFAEWAAG